MNDPVNQIKPVHSWAQSGRMCMQGWCELSPYQEIQHCSQTRLGSARFCWSPWEDFKLLGACDLCSANQGCGTASLCNQVELISAPFCSFMFPFIQVTSPPSPQHLLLNIYLRAEIDVSAANNLFLKKERNCCLLLFPLVFRSQPRVTR